jgi:serine/threonine-protein kinase RsbW
VVGIAPPSTRIKWDSLSFASTLYLYPVIDTLLDHAPAAMHDDLRLGLQEALVNAAKHGNQLDPAKQISVQYARVGPNYWWIISDQGNGFSFPTDCRLDKDSDGLDFISECGRGLFILYQIFDQVRWHRGGKELHLCKQVTARSGFWGRLIPNRAVS